MGSVPQLDVIAFIGQYTWTLIVLCSIYAIVVNEGLGGWQRMMGVRHAFVSGPSDITGRGGGYPAAEVVRDMCA
ncbi:ATP synthase F0 subunit 8 (mitochondrion) [Amphimedon queenslandica]|uniref:ATP synthase F0 subunit 8 n=1 Tax=Amphimedon queenslandica TaxID=400682 RepID=A2T563_AMPQE|nr:ATP synthase F0 subunit 8 [Amphimedon queenslandica]ABI48993.1 ATP synthase F0 subunit 8 [Amphimedon queenslandica]|eukprot:YP_001031204.1 ATP synthase F0 subunit 8 (mitochondrion) [Amphimedon queenslandica]